MKNLILRRLALLLAVCLLLSAVPFAAAAEDCSHSSTTKYYTINENGSGAHQKTEICNNNDCNETLFDDSEFCVDMDNNGECDKCAAIMPEIPLCQHDDTTGSFKANYDGTHTIALVCNTCEADLIELEKDCADDDADGLCDSCNAEMPEPTNAVLSCEQSGTTVNGSSGELIFTLEGVDTEDVEWTFTASGSASPVLENDTDSGLIGVANVYAQNGHGAAIVTATAKWDGGQVRGAAAISFCERETYTVQVAEGVKAFRFMQTKVLSSVTGVAANKVDACSLYRLLTDGCGTYVKLYEDSKLNSRVATITARTTDKTKQYDPEGYNTYSIAGLNSLTFTVTGEGTYELKYEIQEKVGSYYLTTTRGVIDIVCGTPKDKDVNMTYYTASGEAVSFDLTDFISFWEDNRLTRSEELRFVQFDVDEKATGVLYLDSTLRGIVSEDYKFFANLKNEQTIGAGFYELDGVTYRPDPREEAYTEQVTFTAYGRNNGVVRGAIEVVVGEKLPFTDVTAEDWFHEEVTYVFARGIMNGISDTEFDPDGTLTRGMVVTMLHRAAGEPEATVKADFSDVTEEAWYADAVAWAAENNIVNGMGDGTFAPDANITRQQLCAILYRYAAFDLLDTNTGDTDLGAYADRRSIADYAVDAMTWAVYHQILAGTDNYLHPTADATRAQAAVAFCRLLK